MYIKRLRTKDKEKIYLLIVYQRGLSQALRQCGWAMSAA